MDVPMQVTRHFLRQWKYYSDNRHNLSRCEKKNASALFNSLKLMQENEVMLLHEKYCTGPMKRTGRTCKPIIDRVLADKRSIDLQLYKKQRISIEAKLHEKVAKEIERIENQE